MVCTDKDECEIWAKDFVQKHPVGSTAATAALGTFVAVMVAASLRNSLGIRK